jgi:vacuolar protein sorting-associated protein 11
MYEYDEGIIYLCKKLNMRDDLLNFYISKNSDANIMDLCKEHGSEEVNLWIHALKYFVKPEHKKEHYIPEILEELARIPNLSPLPILSILAKSKNIEYQYIKDFFLHK